MKSPVRSRIAGLTLGLVAVALALVAILGMGPDRATAQDDGRLRIVATVSMIGDAVSAVAGERAHVQTLMGEGVDPHLYRQTQADIAAMVGADIVFSNGLYLEAQLEEFLARLAARKPVVPIGEYVPVDERLESTVYAERFDPHVWMTPTLWRHAVEGARDALIALDPAGAEAYTANAAAYIGELEALADYADRSLATVPEDQRVLITAHDAFGYFGQAYDFEVIGIQGLSTESEAGLQQVDRLVGLLVERDISSIFVESSVSERNIRALIEGAAARGHHVTVGGRLFSDAMGRHGTYQGTYIGMIDSNVTTITRALGGEAPEGGMRGMLVGS